MRDLEDAARLAVVVCVGMLLLAIAIVFPIALRLH